MYAFMLAELKYNESSKRIVSIGSGSVPIEILNQAEAFSAGMWVERLPDFLTGI